MDGYTLTAVIVATVGLSTVGCVYFMSRTARLIATDTSKTIRAPIDSSERILTNVTDKVEGVATKAVNAAQETVAPISQGVSEMCRAIAGRIDTKRAELTALREEISRLKYENDRLQSRRISVDQIKPIFQIAFFQSDLSERDFVKKPVKITPGGVIQRQEVIEYFGVYRAKNTQKFGVDLEDLKFKLTSSTVLQVSGLGTTKLIGNLGTEVEDEHVELRKHLTGGRLSEVHEILSDDVDGLKLEWDRIQRKELHNSITKERRINQIEQGVEMMTLQLLKDHFGPRGYTVLKATEEIREPKSIFDIQKELNTLLTDQIESNSRRLAEVGSVQEAAEQSLNSELQRLRDGDFSA